LVVAGLALLGLGARGSAPEALSAEALNAFYAKPLPAPEAGLSVYHLGHSLVGQGMPLTLASLALSLIHI